MKRDSESPCGDLGKVLVVDGYPARSRGRYACAQRERLPARLLLSGEVHGAFDEVRVYDRWLDDDELIPAAEITRVRAYLQEQQPPPGAPLSGRAGRQVSYVDPATCRLGSATVAETSGIYNPAKMPQLPPTPHTKWARPLAGGPIRAVLIMPAEFYDDRSCLREGAAFEADQSPLLPLPENGEPVLWPNPIPRPLIPPEERGSSVQARCIRTTVRRSCCGICTIRAAGSP